MAPAKRKKPTKLSESTLVNQRTPARAVDNAGTPVTQASFAALAGVSRQAISKALRPGGPLAEAALESGRIDAAHPCAVAYLDEHAADTGGEIPPDAQADLAALAGTTDLAAVAARAEQHGGLARYVALLQAARADADRRLATLRAAALEGRLIPREPVRVHVIGAIDGLHRRLLTDFCVSAARELRVSAAAGESREQLERRLRSFVSTQLHGSRAAVLRRLDGIEPTDRPPAEPPLPEPAPPPPIKRELHEAITTAVHEQAAPRLLDVASRAIARALAGQPFDHTVFDRAMTAAESVREDATRNAATSLCAIVDRVIADALAQRTQPKEAAA